ncbi:MAG TPA: DUF3376 domain-containing protein, partial [Bryobacteraceae bacterium]|nr:DUF3376 domain-containing protein [Bryobacteraceae bacterium]
THGPDGSKFEENPPKSLLSSRGMYSKLIRALGEMEKGASEGPLQPEMDVFITATDLQGLEMPIDLADETVFEKRYRNVFHLRLRQDGSAARNDFTKEMNPFLAFAGRATSSFPFAFEPMRLADAEENSGKLPDAERLFPEYIAAGGAGYELRAFGDGGYLDNKPFSYAIEELPRRIARLPMRRMLAYMEPAPDEIASNATKAPPDFIQNAFAATVTLHQHETIREDLKRVLERNRLMDRVKEVTSYVEKDAAEWEASGKPRAARQSGAEYAPRTLDQQIHDRGPGYASYHRLKVRSVTDLLAKAIERAAGIRDGSEGSRSVRSLAEQWREQTFSEDNPQQSESAFLLQFDLEYRQRRLRFLLTKLDERAASHPEDRGAIWDLKDKLNKVAADLGELNRACREWGKKNPVFDVVEGRSLSVELIASAAQTIAAKFRGALIQAAAAMESDLNPEGKTGIEVEICKWLQPYFEHYEDYDQIVFPILYETGAGEAEPAEVFRISPKDAPSLINEQDPKERRRKLAGTALFHFGAFLNRDWRSNDILWGRLDGAERIISSILPRGSEDTARLIRKAHLAIIREHFHTDDPESVYEELRAKYEVNRNLRPVYMAGVLLRSADIACKMLEGLAGAACLEKLRALNPQAWFAKLRGWLHGRS